jgi:hypothetical protein
VAAVRISLPVFIVNHPLLLLSLECLQSELRHLDGSSHALPTREVGESRRGRGWVKVRRSAEREVELNESTYLEDGNLIF